MAAAAPLRRQEATYLDGTWGWGREDPQTGEPLFSVSSVVRTPMAFEEEAWGNADVRATENTPTTVEKLTCSSLKARAKVPRAALCTRETV